jgi:CDP-diacylglycerol--serine O-phosphatidyltransferase
MNIAKEPRRGIYLLPNLLTTAALFAGFYAIVQTLKGHLEIAAIAIFIAMVADNLDGRVARLTHTQTAFGAEYDSLSDIVCFGIAPALLGFKWGLSSLGNLGWLAAFLYVAATALRLARFNTQVGIADKRYYQGLPCPPAAAIVTGFIWVIEDNNWSSTYWLKGILIMLMIFSAVLMVSRIRYSSFKQFNWHDRVPFVSLLLLVLIFTFISLNTSAVLFGLALIFGFSGPVMTLWRLRQRRLERKPNK